MVNLRWDGDDFRNEQDSSGSTADLVSHSGKLQQGYKHGSLTEGLVAYYPMERGEGDLVRDGALNNTGRIVGASWSGDSRTGSGSMSFDGVDDRIDVGDDPEAKGDFTLAAWVKISSGGGGAITDNYNGSFPQAKLRVHNGEFSNRPVGSVRVRLHDSSDKLVIDSSQKVDDGAWHHIGGLRRGDTVILYIDGVEDVRDSNSTMAEDLRNGVRRWGARPDGNSGEFFGGLIDDARAYNRALSQPEIQALYNLSNPSGTQVTEKDVPGQDQGGVSRYKFNGDVTDSWGSNDGTNNGADLTTTGVYGQAAKFNGSSDYISTNLALDTNSDFTFAAWLNVSKDLSNFMEVITNSDDSSSYEGGYLYINSGRLFFEVDDGSNQNRISTSKADTGKWQHVAGSYNSTKEKVAIYVNGKITGSSKNTSLGDSGSSASITIGASSDKSSGFYGGKMDDVRIYNTALTPQQVEKLYHKGAYRIPRESTLQ